METRKVEQNNTKGNMEINDNINVNPDLVREAPIKTPVTRLDETKANRELNLRWTP